MHFTHVTLHVKDIEQSLAFYHGALGMPVARRLSGADGPVFLGGAGGPLIELIGGAERPAFAGFSLGFTVPSLADAEAALAAAGYPKVRGPISPRPGVAFSFFKDPGGAEIELVEQRA